MNEKAVQSYFRGFVLFVKPFRIRFLLGVSRSINEPLSNFLRMFYGFSMDFLRISTDCTRRKPVERP